MLEDTKLNSFVNKFDEDAGLVPNKSILEKNLKIKDCASICMVFAEMK